MTSKMLPVLLLVVFVSMCQAKNVNLGSSSTACGTQMILAKNEQLNVYSTGGAPNGYCSVLIHAMNEVTSDCPYTAFCVAVVQNSMNQCSAKVFLTGTSFDVTGSNSKEVSCYSSTYGAWCTQSNSLEISVLEDPKPTRSGYGFNLTVLSECRDQPPVEFTPETSNSKKIEEIEAEISQNRIVGVVVGVCLACMFLVILFISYNYYKNKPTYRQQRDT